MTWRSPTGGAIVGTSDTMLCRANITDINDDGSPQYEGYTELFWDTQETLRSARGERLYLDENGDEWPFDQLVKTEEESMKFTLELSSKRICDLMTTAIENNSSVRSWCSYIHLTNHDLVKKTKKRHPDEPWYACEEVFDHHHFELELGEIVDETHLNKIKKHILNIEDFRHGIVVMAQKHPRQFGEILDDNEDADTADTFLQCVVFKELVYG